MKNLKDKNIRIYVFNISTPILIFRTELLSLLALHFHQHF